MKKVLFSIIILLLVATVVQAKVISIPIGSGRANSSVSSTYANSQVDTITIIREPGVTSLTLSITTSDSVCFGATIAGKIYRKIDSNLLTWVANDSLTLTSLVSTSNTGASYAGNIVISSATQALPSSYVIYVTYAASGNGVSTPTVVYKAQKNYAYKP
jgi:hypothetical protein